MVHRRVLKLQKLYPDRIFMLDFDNLCKNREEILLKLSAYVESSVNLTNFKNIISAPTSIGRYKNFSLQNFNEQDVDYISTIYQY
jgi:hypothetical protein